MSDINNYESQLKELISMGFSEKASIIALNSNSGNLENAVNLILSLGEEKILQQEAQSSNYNNSKKTHKKIEKDEDDDDDENEEYTYDSSDSSDNEPIKELKMQILVRMDLQMGKGKIAGQCCHGCLGLVRFIEHSDNVLWKKNLEEWIDNIEAKIILKVPDEKTLMEYYYKAEELGHPAVYIEDAGRTQIEPNSKTVVAIGPLPVEEFEFTRNLKLL